MDPEIFTLWSAITNISQFCVHPESERIKNKNTVSRIMMGFFWIALKLKTHMEDGSSAAKDEIN